MPRGWTVCLACAIWLPSACQMAVVGSGKKKVETRELGEFERVVVRGALPVKVMVGETCGVELVGDDNLLPLILTRVSDRELSIQTASNRSYRPKVPLEIFVALPTLKKLSGTGAVSIEVDGARGDELAVVAHGASKIRAQGAVTKLNAEAHGASEMDLSGLESEDATIDCSGASKIDVSASRSLSGSASGASSVSYRGSPNITLKTTGASTVHSR